MNRKLIFNVMFAFIIILIVFYIIGPNFFKRDYSDSVYEDFLLYELEDMKEIKLQKRVGFGSNEFIELTNDQQEEIFFLLKNALVQKTQARTITEYGYFLFVEISEDEIYDFILMFEDEYLLVAIGNKSFASPQMYDWFDDMLLTQ